MRRTVLYIAMSLDGYIADRSGEVDWLYGSGEGEGSYGEFSRTVGTVIMGRTTYDQITTVLSPGDWPYCGMSCYVVTNRPAAPAEGVTFTSEPPSALVRRLREGSLLVEHPRNPTRLSGSYRCLPHIRHPHAAGRRNTSVRPAGQGAAAGFCLLV